MPYLGKLFLQRAKLRNQVFQAARFLELICQVHCMNKAMTPAKLPQASQHKEHVMGQPPAAQRVLEICEGYVMHHNLVG